MNQLDLVWVKWECEGTFVIMVPERLGDPSIRPESILWTCGLSSGHKATKVAFRMFPSVLVLKTSLKVVPHFEKIQ